MFWLNFFGMTDANAERITKQNSRPIMLVIGNPPYNANQANENENNKNREYPEIDQRIKDTYIYYSTAQKSKVYDMYARFYRWASDRLDKNGIIAYITNSSFLDSKTFDGFRKVVSDEFSHIYIVDLGGNVRKNPKLSGTTHNVFGIQTGVAIAFFVKTDKREKTSAQVLYTRRPEMELATEKLDYLGSTKIAEIKFEHIHPDKQSNWLNLAENDWSDLIPIASKEGKAEKGIKEPKTIFKNFSLGVATNRDEWVYDESPENLEKKIQYFFGLFENEKNRWAQSDKKKAINDFVDRSIKWTSELEAHLKRGTKLEFSKTKITSAMYRPFVKRPFYYDMVIVHRPYQQPRFFRIGEKSDNHAICMNMNGKDFNVLSVNSVPDLHFNGDSQCLPLYRYGESGNRVENITDWVLGQFQKHYKDKKITKEDIFHYVYAVLHHPTYRAKYEINLKREFPRIPFYEGFWKWAEWGKQLMDLHLNYESVEPYPLERGEREGKVAVPNDGKGQPACRLIARKEQGIIEVDTATTLRGVPAEAWEYRLGTYSALEWILERYKEKRPKDPTIAEKFNTYRFADYKEQVIDLLQRVCTVSVETMRIVKEMP
jgi:predicted helicase